MIKKLGNVKDGLLGGYRSRIRERAITQAKARTCQRASAGSHMLDRG